VGGNKYITDIFRGGGVQLQKAKTVVMQGTMALKMSLAKGEGNAKIKSARWKEWSFLVFDKRKKEQCCKEGETGGRDQKKTSILGKGIVFS